MCGLSLAWVTSENSTSTSNADILSRSSSLDPILSPTVSGVRCWLPLSVVPRQPSAARLSAVQPPTALCWVASSTPACCPTPTALCRVASSTPIRVPLPLPDTARFQVQESFVWFRAKTDKGIICFGSLPTECYLHTPLLPLSFILNKLQHNSTTSKKTQTFTVSNNRNYKILKGFGRPPPKNNKWYNNTISSYT